MDNIPSGPLPTEAAIMADYRYSMSILTDEQEGWLHSFFSPFTVPALLADDQVAVCILLYQMRKQHQSLHKVAPKNADEAFAEATRSPWFPVELSRGGPISRGTFARGIRKLLWYDATGHTS